MTTLKNLKLYQTQELKLWPNSKTQLMSKLTFLLNLKIVTVVTKLKKNTQIVTKLKNSNCEKNLKLKKLSNSKTQIVTKLKYSNYDRTQRLKVWQNLKIQIGKELKTQLKNSTCDKILKIKGFGLSGQKKSPNFSGQKKSPNLFGQKNHPTSWDKKITQPLGTKTIT